MRAPRASAGALVAIAVGCGAKVNEKPAPPPCEQACQDRIVVRAIRETAKLAYNATLQGNPVGPQDETTPCPLGGSAHVFGTAASNALQGATEVNLTYAFDGCGYLVKDDSADQSYRLTLSGTLRQSGTLAVQPTSTTALILDAAEIRFDGTVYDPPISVSGNCALTLGQNGNQLSGTVCDREVGVDL